MPRPGIVTPQDWEVTRQLIGHTTEQGTSLQTPGSAGRLPGVPATEPTGLGLNFASSLLVRSTMRRYAN